MLNIFVFKVIFVSLHNSLEQLDFKGEHANVSETYGMSVALACVLEIARAVDILVHASTRKRPSSSFIHSKEDISQDSKDKTGLGSEAMKDLHQFDEAPGEGKDIGFKVTSSSLPCM